MFHVRFLYLVLVLSLLFTIDPSNLINLIIEKRDQNVINLTNYCISLPCQIIWITLRLVKPCIKNIPEAEQPSRSAL